MSTTVNTPADKPKRNRIPAFTPATPTQVSELVAAKKLTEVSIEAKPARTTKSGKNRPAREARTEYFGNRAGILALYGGNEAAMLFAAAKYFPIAVKSLTRKERVKDPKRAANRAADAFKGLTPELLASLPPDVRKAAEAMQAFASANPVPPRKRAAKTSK